MISDAKQHLHALERHHPRVVLNIAQSIDYRLTCLAHIVVAIVRRLLSQHKAHETVRKRGMYAMPLAAVMTAQRRAVSLDATQDSY